MREGRRIRRSLATSDEAEAIVKARELRYEVESVPSGTFAQEIEAYIADRRAKRRISERYAENLKITLNAIAKEMGVEYVVAATPVILAKYKHRIQARAIESTAATYLDFLARFLTYLKAEGKIGCDFREALSFKLPRKNIRRQFLGKVGATKILSKCTDESLRFCILCALHAGLRKEEVIESRRDWFDLKRRTLHVKRSETWEPKDDEERVIPLTDTFVRFLRKFPKRESHQYMLAPHKLTKGKWRYRYDFRRPFVEYMKSQNASSITFHDLRRSFASNLASAGESLYLIAKWLGDDPRVVAKTYAHIAPDTRGKIDKLG